MLILLPDDATHSGQPWILPPINYSLINQPGELPLGHHRVGQVQPGVSPDVRLPQAQGINEPVELIVPVVKN